jgi:Xaa-Pro aminopeptidase
MITLDAWHAELKSRRSIFWEIVESHGCDIGLVYGSLDRNEPFRYLTNFVPALGDMWALLSPGSQMNCFLHFHWQLEEASELSGVQEWVGVFDLLPVLVENLAALNARRAAVFGAERIPQKAVEAIHARLPHLELIDADTDFARLRRTKSRFEIDVLRRAIRITDDALDIVRAEIRPGVTEKQIAARVSYYFNLQGAQEAFFPMVLAGVDRPAIARLPSDYAFKAGDTIMVDVGASWHGYQADIARTFILGPPSSLQQKAWDTIRRVYDMLLDLARPGTPCNRLHQTAVRIFEAEGFRLLHRIGHGYGLATSFEWPSLDTENTVLAPGMTLALEPALYHQGAGNAMKLEDDVLVTQDGCEVLSAASRDWVIAL